MNKNYTNFLIFIILLAFVVGGVSGAWFGSFYTTKLLRQISPQTFGHLNILTPFKNLKQQIRQQNSQPSIFDRLAETIIIRLKKSCNFAANLFQRLTR